MGAVISTLPRALHEVRLRASASFSFVWNGVEQLWVDPVRGTLGDVTPIGSLSGDSASSDKKRGRKSAPFESRTLGCPEVLLR